MSKQLQRQQLPLAVGSIAVKVAAMAAVSDCGLQSCNAKANKTARVRANVPFGSAGVAVTLLSTAI